MWRTLFLMPALAALGWAALGWAALGWAALGWAALGHEPEAPPVTASRIRPHVLVAAPPPGGGRPCEEFIGGPGELLVWVGGGAVVALGQEILKAQ